MSLIKKKKLVMTNHDFCYISKTAFAVSKNYLQHLFSFAIVALSFLYVCNKIRQFLL